MGKEQGSYLEDRVINAGLLSVIEDGIKEEHKDVVVLIQETLQEHPVLAQWVIDKIIKARDLEEARMVAETVAVVAEAMQLHEDVATGRLKPEK